MIGHELGKGQTEFSYHKRTIDNIINNKTVSSCSSYYLEPVQWMSECISNGGVEGKLHCPQCDAKIGAFNWYGMQCSCGNWTSPGFSIQKKQVDEIIAVGVV